MNRPEAHYLVLCRSIRSHHHKVYVASLGIELVERDGAIEPDREDAFPKFPLNSYQQFAYGGGGSRLRS